MEAKDTVMKPEQIAACLNRTIGAETGDSFGAKDIKPEDFEIAETQAGISFKAGMKEVVDTVNSLGMVAVVSQVASLDKWQAKLKEWGVISTQEEGAVFMNKTKIEWAKNPVKDLRQEFPL